MRDHVDQPVSAIARWIVERKVLTFMWRQQRWIPAFQFDEDGMVLREVPQKVFAELTGVFDDLEVASWFATPNLLLGDAAPVDRIVDHPCCVIAAARLDRFVAKG